MARCSYEAIVEFDYSARPYLISRSMAIGSHTLACQSWSGDNSTSWHTLKHNIPMGINASLSLIGGYGHDVGGFVGPRPSKNLFIRWIQNGIFMPRFCIHSWKSEGVTTPWMYPEATKIIRNAIEFRYKIVPYIYSLSMVCSEAGDPVIRPTFFEFPKDCQTRNQNFEFMLGPWLLVASVYEDSTKRSVYLPGSVNWYSIWTGTWHEGGLFQDFTVPIETPGCLFAKAGSMIPISPCVKSVSQTSNDCREIWIFPDSTVDGQSEYVISDDDGISKDGRVFQFKVSMRWNGPHEDVVVDLSVLAHSGFKPLYTGVLFVLPQGDERKLRCSCGESLVSLHLSFQMEL